MAKPPNTLDEILANYLEDSDTTQEFEIKFGTKGIHAITKIKYQNVIKKLISLGFKPLSSQDTYLLRIVNNFITQDGSVIQSNIRTELEGLGDIQKYCRTNELVNRETGQIDVFADFVQKKKKKFKEENIKPVDNRDFNFRASLSTETNFNATSNIIKELLTNWNENKKIFRYMNRVRLVHEEFPLFVDCSIVKSSKRKGYSMISDYTIQEANVFNNMESYEIEIEMDNSKKMMDDVPGKLKKVIKYVLSGLQESNYPIGFNETNTVIRDYMRLIHRKEMDTRRIYPSHFIGPSSKTLQFTHIQEENMDLSVPNIRKDYTVTDKADGMRKLLYINKTGKLYFITTNMSVQYTGAVCKNPKLYDTLLDGEHILHNKMNKFIHLYAPFDIYYHQSTDVRSKPFVNTEPSEKGLEVKYRLHLLQAYVTQLKQDTNLRQLRIQVKEFRMNKNIFVACKEVLRHTGDTNYEYETDGLIFTPASLGVGQTPLNKQIKDKKITWGYSFKWKPSYYNTIDFFITTNKTPDGKDIVEYKYQDGIDLQGNTKIIKYKTVTLRVGFDPSRDGYLNPCMDVIQDNIPSAKDDDTNDSYQPMAFVPTDPYDPETNQCNLELSADQYNVEQMKTEEGEIITDNMIVEFRYDTSKPNNWCWIPLRIRWDKTAELRSGFRNYGNGYHVANDNWYSIHHPITPNMISTGDNIPENIGGEEKYYDRGDGNKKVKGNTVHLRDFHNKYVKKMLITKVSTPGNTLIDLAVGKAGDMYKWIQSKLSFVLGIDYANDNIHNRLDGACARYLNMRKKMKTMPYALFVHGDSSENIKDNSGIFTERGKMVINSVFGVGENNEQKIGKGVFRQYGKGVDGFNICSCQFAIHYFFESKNKVHQFLKNVTETTKVGGYFIGTSYDGTTLFNELSRRKQGESIHIYSGEHKVWEIVKQYAFEEFNNDESSIGYAVDVYQETIGKMFREYLVNYTYLIQLIENYGFSLISDEEAKKLKLPNATGMFSELYNEMNQYHKENKDYQSALNMTPDEKKISFLNRYFVFKKVRTVDPNAIYMSDTTQEQAELQVTTDELERALQKEEAVVAGIPESGLESKEESASPNYSQWLEQEGYSPLKWDTQSEIVARLNAEKAAAAASPAAAQPAAASAAAAVQPTAAEAAAVEALPTAAQPAPLEAVPTAATVTEAAAESKPVEDKTVRGVDNRPAWMTRQTAVAEAAAETKPVEDKTVRGVDNRPAWMTRQTAVVSEAVPTLPSAARPSPEEGEIVEEQSMVGGSNKVKRLTNKIVLG